MANQRSTGMVKTPKIPPAPRQATLTFDDQRIVAGMVFHLIDDEHATCVSDASIQITRERLQKKNVRLSIAREHWEAMSNRERLEWLLARSHTQTVYSGRTAILAAES
jgi:hypothetical protein